jgi:hypothetical protein
LKFGARLPIRQDCSSQRFFQWSLNAATAGLERCGQPFFFALYSSLEYGSKAKEKNDMNIHLPKEK